MSSSDLPLYDDIGNMSGILERAKRIKKNRKIRVRNSRRRKTHQYAISILEGQADIRKLISGGINPGDTGKHFKLSDDLHRTLNKIHRCPSLWLLRCGFWVVVQLILVPLLSIRYTRENSVLPVALFFVLGFWWVSFVSARCAAMEIAIEKRQMLEHETQKTDLWCEYTLLSKTVSDIVQVVTWFNVVRRLVKTGYIIQREDGSFALAKLHLEKLYVTTRPQNSAL